MCRHDVAATTFENAVRRHLPTVVQQHAQRAIADFDDDAFAATIADVDVIAEFNAIAQLDALDAAS
jgi:hypothetical protein